jgi:hypothetical protein
MMEPHLYPNDTSGHMTNMQLPVHNSQPSQLQPVIKRDPIDDYPVSHVQMQVPLSDPVEHHIQTSPIQASMIIIDWISLNHGLQLRWLRVVNRKLHICHVTGSIIWIFFNFYVFSFLIRRIKYIKVTRYKTERK